MSKNLRLNDIPNRQYILSPAVESGNDRESSINDFYQEDVELPSIGRLGMGMKVIHHKTQMLYTIISFDKDKIAKSNLVEKINSVIALMYKCSHPYLFRLLNHYETSEYVFLIFEAYEGDSLDKLIEKGKCDKRVSLKYFVEVILALQHMHNFGFYDLNIFPENILISECVKLTDYGLKMSGKNEKPKRDTRYLHKKGYNYIINAYTTPEEINSILNDTTYTSNAKTDSWNCGILLYEMLTNFGAPFKGNTDEEFFNAIANAEIDLSLIKDDFCRDLISKLIVKNPDDRMSLDEVLNLDYIKNVDIEQPEIEFSDNIINPNDNEEEGNMRSSGKSSKSKNNKNDNNDENLKNENKEKNNENKENKKEKNKDKKDNQQNDSNSNSYSESESDESSDESSSNDKNAENLYERCEKFKKKNMNLKKRIKELKNKVSELNENVTQLNNDKSQFEAQKKLNTINNFEKINSVPINNINDLSNQLLSTINIFNDSQKNLKTLIDKLITMSKNEHNTLIEENNKYIEKKGKIFFDLLKKMNLAEVKDDSALIKEKEERKKMEKIKNNQITEYKTKYENYKKKEESLNEKLKAVMESYNAVKELNDNLVKQQEESGMRSRLLEKEIKSLEDNIDIYKKFIYDNIKDEEKLEKLKKLIQLQQFN